MERSLEYSSAGCRVEDAEGGCDSGARRGGIYIRNCGHALRGGPVGADGGGAAFERGTCAPRGGVYTASGFDVAAACAGGRAIHGIDVERSGGAAAGARNHERSAAGV